MKWIKASEPPKSNGKIFTRIKIVGHWIPYISIYEDGIWKDDDAEIYRKDLEIEWLDESPSSPAVSGEEIERVAEIINKYANDNTMTPHRIARLILFPKPAHSPTPLPATDEEIEKMAEAEYPFPEIQDGEGSNKSIYEFCCTMIKSKRTSWIKGYKASHPTKRPG